MITILLACIFFGVNTKFYFNLKEKKASFQVVIFSSLVVLRVDFLLFNSNIYYCINHHAYKTLKIKAKNKSRKFNFIYPIKIDNLNVFLMYANEENCLKTLFGATVVAYITEYLPEILKKYFVVDDFEKTILPKFHQTNTILLLNLKISDGIFDIFKNLLHAKTKGEIYANRKFN